MAIKNQTVSSHEGGYMTGYAEFTIKGAEYVRGTAEEPVLRVPAIPMPDIKWQAVQDLLTDAGIGNDDAMQYVDSFAGRIHKMELAKALAELVTLV